MVCRLLDGRRGLGSLDLHQEPRSAARGEVARRFFGLILGQADRAGLLSKEHFSVDGTLIEALASLKSYRPKDEDGPPGGGGRNPHVDFHGEKRRRDTHESKTDKDALLFKKTKGSESKLAYLGHLLMENRHGLVVNAQVTQATGTAEREAAIDIPPRQNSCRLYDFVI
ncbi:MAG: hypothetical protein H6961_09830 [Chromatiaceae bacterium]|nr:hypothetical protein [Chromatiaceae bacterium]